MTDDPNDNDTETTEEDAMARLREQLNAIGLPRLAISAATVAAVGAMASYFFSGDDAPGPDVGPAAGGVTLCHPDLFTTADACTTTGQLLEGERSDVFSPGVISSRPVTMISPDDDEAAPREVRTCVTFAPLKRAGWGGLTTADQRREAQLVRVCGLLALTAAAKPVPKPQPMDAAAWAAIDGTSLPALGPAGFPADVTIEKGDDPWVWSASTDAVSGRFVDIAMLDLDGDGAGEHLIEWTLVANGGTFASRGFGVVTPGAGRFAVVDPFAD